MAMPLLGARRGRVLRGAAVTARALKEDPAVRRAARQCGSLTGEIDFKWDRVAPRRDGWIFAGADAIADFAHQHGQRLRGHTLLWEQSTPAWAKQELAERRDWAVVDRWIGAICGRYPRIREWDVVNEPIDTERGEAGLRRTCFQTAFGADYIRRALEIARAHAPRTRLMLNEYGLEYANPVERDRRVALVRLAARLKAAGVPLDGIGLQAHLDLAKGPPDAAGIAAMLREFKGMGLQVAITELDVREADRSLSVERRDRAAADAATRYLDIVQAEVPLTGITTWGLSDRDSWLQDGGVFNRGLPYDATFRGKPLLRVLKQHTG